MSATQILQAIAARSEQIAVECPDGLITGGDLLRRVDLWRGMLRRLGARRVAVRTDNSVEWIALDLALLAEACISVPVPDFFTDTQAAHVIEQVGIDCWIDRSGASLPHGFSHCAEHADQVIARREVSVAPKIPGGCVKITFTSGSTGAAKGVCLSEQHLMSTANSLCDAMAGLHVQRHASVLPFALLLENVAGIYANLINGSTLVVRPLQEIGLLGGAQLDAPRFVEALSEAQPHSVILVPQLLLGLTAAAEFGLPLSRTLKFAAVGGGKVSRNLLQRAEAVGIPAFEGYGLSECGSVVALNRPGVNRHGSVGKVLPHASVEIVDGEIHVSDAVMLGYLGGDDASKSSWASGDLGSLDADGFLTIHGRKKNCFITSFGRNVQPEWVESELQAEINVAQACVFGEASPINVAVLVPRFDAGSLAAAVDAANLRLPDYARVSRWIVADAEQFSGCLTTNGRVRRREVERIYGPQLDTMLTEQPMETFNAVL